MGVLGCRDAKTFTSNLEDTRKHTTETTTSQATIIFQLKLMKFAGNGIFSRRDLNRWFGEKPRRPDAECWELERFVAGIIAGSGFEFKCWGDFCDFQQKYGNVSTLFKSLYENKQGDWPVFETHEGKTRYAWWSDAESTSGIEFSKRVSEWVEFPKTQTTGTVPMRTFKEGKKPEAPEFEEYVFTSGGVPMKW